MHQEHNIITDNKPEKVRSPLTISILKTELAYSQRKR